MAQGWMYSSPSTEVKLKLWRIVDFSRKVCILVKRENVVLKERALPKKFI